MFFQWNSSKINDCICRNYLLTHSDYQKQQLQSCEKIRFKYAIWWTMYCQMSRSCRNINMLGGAGEACWAHNPKVRGSKPLRATNLLFGFLAFTASETGTYLLVDFYVASIICHASAQHWGENGMFQQVVNLPLSAMQSHGFRTGNRVAQYKIFKTHLFNLFYIFFTQFYTKLVFGAKSKFSTFARKLLAQWLISNLRYCSNPFYNHFFGAI